MQYVIWVCAAIGAIWILVYLVWPLVEAVIYGFMSCLVTLLAVRVKWTWKTWRWILCMPWVSAWRRLTRDCYVTEIEQRGWVYRPPFHLHKRPQAPAEDDLP